MTDDITKKPAYPRPTFSITWTRDASGHDCFEIKSRFYSREQMENIVLAISQLGASMPSEGIKMPAAGCGAGAGFMKETK